VPLDFSGVSAPGPRFRLALTMVPPLAYLVSDTDLGHNPDPGISENIFKPPPLVGAGGGHMFSGRPSVPLSVRPCMRPSVRDSHGSFMFPRYLQYLLTDFRQTFVTGASRNRDELIRFWGQKVKVQGHTIAAEVHSTRRYRRVQLFLVIYYRDSCRHPRTKHENPWRSFEL